MPARTLTRIQICSRMSYELDQSITGSHFALNIFFSQRKGDFDLLQSNDVME